MIIINDITFTIKEKTAVAIGKFDGVHLGHRKLLDEIIKAKVDGLKAVVFTFDPPVEELFSNGPFKYLTTKEEKRSIFEKMGVDYLIEFPISVETAAIPPEQFIEEYIANYMNASLVVCGNDLSFGKNGTGNFNLLSEYSSKLGYKAVSIDKVHHQIGDMDYTISSTAIREKVFCGNMESANELLGYAYEINGKVIRGNQIGRTMGVPTVNLNFDEAKLIPAKGVYYSSIVFDGSEYKSITNIGTKPTIKDDFAINAETFIYDFEGDLYGKNITVKLHAFKRPEKKFNSFEELEAQIKADIEDGKSF